MSSVDIELDCGWAYAGGEDPAQLIVRHADRVTMLHLKDMSLTDDGQYRSVPLGQGLIDISAIMIAARRCRVSTAYVEQEAPFASPPRQAAAQSLSQLRSLGFLS